MSDWIDKQRASEILGCNPRHVHRLAQHGKIPFRVFVNRRTKKRYRLFDGSWLSKSMSDSSQAPELSPDDGHHLAGLADGEGSFLLVTRQRVQRKNKSLTFIGNEASFKISLREDDADMIILIRKTLGFGKVIFRNGYGPSRPTVTFDVSRHADALKLVDILTKYPLRSKKRRDFEIWKEFVLERDKPNFDQSKLDALREKLLSVREYQPPSADLLAEAARLNAERPFALRKS